MIQVSNLYPFAVGDCVEVKSIDEMIKELGRRPGSNMPRTEISFLPAMSYLCGSVLHISEIKPDGSIRSVEDVESEHCGLARGYWKISMDMLKPYDEGSAEPIDVFGWESILTE